MTTKYARAAGGVWTTNGTWSTTSSAGTANTVAPTAGDDVIIDSGSGALTISSASVCRSADFTGYTNTLTHNSGQTLTIGDGTAGLGNIALKLVSGMTYTLQSATSSAITFVSTSTQQTIDFGGRTCGNVSFNSSSGNWAITSNFTQASVAVFTVTQGTVHLDGAADNSGLTHTFGGFNSNNSNTRTINLGASNITCAANAGAWNTTSTTGLTFTCGTSIITFTGAASTASSVFNSADITFNTVNVNCSGPVISTFTGTVTFANLSRNGAVEKVSAWSVAGNMTVTTSLTLAGNSVTNRLLMYRVSQTSIQSVMTVTGATVSITNCDFQSMSFSPSKNLAAITGGSGDCGGNANITFTTPVTRFWIGNAGSWSDSSHWSTSTGGSGGATVPLPQDTTTFDSNSISTSAQQISFDMPRPCKDVSFANVTNNPTWQWNSSGNITFYGSVTFKSGMSRNSGTGLPIFQGRSTHTITTGGTNLAGTTISSIGGTYSLGDNFDNGSNAFTVTNGTFNLAGFNLSCNNFVSNTVSTRTITLGSGTLTVSGTGTIWDLTSGSPTVNGNTSTIVISDTSSTSKTFAGAGKTYNNLSITGSGTGAAIFTGSNTFNTITINAPKTVTFTAGTTTTVSGFVATGTLGNVITINSDTPSSTATLSKSSGNVSCDYLALTDSTATGGATWYAGKNSTNTRTSGWLISSPVPGSATIANTVVLTPSGMVNHNASTNLTATVTLTPSGSRLFKSSATIANAVVLTPSGMVNHNASTNLTATVTLTPNGSKLFKSSATIANTVGLTPTSMVNHNASTNLTATVTLTPSGSKLFKCSANLTANCTLNPVAKMFANAGTNITIQNALTPSGLRYVNAGGNILVSSSLTASGFLSHNASTNLSSSVVVSGAGVVIHNAGTHITVTNTLTPNTRKITFASGSISVASSLTPGNRVYHNGISNISVSGILTPSAKRFANASTNVSIISVLVARANGGTSRVQYSITQIDQLSFLLSYTSEQAPPVEFRIYREGVLLKDEISVDGTGSIVLSIGAGESPFIEVLDNSCDQPSYAAPGRLTLNWDAVSSAVSYIVEQQVSSIWHDIGNINDDGSGVFTFLTPWLSEGSHSFRIVPQDLAGNSGSPYSFTGIMVRHPDVPNTRYSFNPSTKKVTLNS